MLTKSTSSADTMKICLMVLWNVEIHYQIYVLRIYATSCL